MNKKQKRSTNLLPLRGQGGCPLRFTHFSRKGYALFSVLGREVLVGVLAVSTLTYAKAEGVSTDTSYALDSLTREEVKLEEVIVTGSRAPLTQLQSAKIVSVVTRDDIARAAAESINDVLKLVPGVDVRQRGGFGVQTDISVRGGNFDQITILLNGINISSPHTGHLSADFPISPDDIERIEVLEGGYENGLNGVINIITTAPSPQPDILKQVKSTPKGAGGVNTLVNLYGGSYGYGGGNARLSYNSPFGGRGAHWGALSGGYTRSDGATNNSAFSSTKLFYNGGISLGKVDIDAQLGYSYKPFEANTFYGASSTDQWESNERLISSITGSWHSLPSPTRRGAGGEVSLYFNRWFDHYQWHRNNPAGENYHKVDARGASLQFWFNSFLGKTSVGGEARNEGIWSTKLGILQDESKWKNSGGHDAQDDIKYKYHDSRTVWKAFAEHHILLEQWTISPALTFMSIGDNKKLLPSINIAYRPTDHWKLFTSWNTGLRMPTFTDLYYSGANIEGNSNLKPEKSSDFQLGVRKTGRGFVVESNVFYSHKTDMIDWVTYQIENGELKIENSDGIFHSVNFKQDSWGGEMNVSLLPREWLGENFAVRKLNVKYAYINEDSEYGVKVIQSKYAMDYLRNKIVVDADGRIWKNLNMSLSWRWQDRIGESNPSYALLDARLSWNAKKYCIYVDGTNILNKEYYDYISIRQPGIVVIGGVKINL